LRREKSKKRLLLITLLDFRARPNDRTGHAIRALREHVEEVWLLCRAEPAVGGVATTIRNVLPLPTRIFREGNLTIVEYNPPLNYTTGYSEGGGGEVSRPRIKSALNLFGLIREFFVISTILYVSLRHLRGGFQLCIVETFWEGVVALFLRSIGKVRYLVFDDNDFNPGYMRNSLRRRWEIFWDTWCARRADLIITIGHLLADYWRERTGREVHVVPNGVDFNRFGVVDVKKNALPRHLMYVGTLSSSWVDFECIFGSMKQKIDEGVQLDLKIVGTGRDEYIEGLKTLIAELGLTEHVTFLGRVEYGELPDIMSRCDIGLAISPRNLLRRYAFPLKVVEWMAMGLPVIGNKGMEMERIIDHYRVGICIEPDVKEMTAALTRLMDDRDFFSTCRANAIAGSRDFDLEKLAAMRYDLLYRRFFQAD